MIEMEDLYDKINSSLSVFFEEKDHWYSVEFGYNVPDCLVGSIVDNFYFRTGKGGMNRERYDSINEFVKDLREYAAEHNLTPKKLKFKENLCNDDCEGVVVDIENIADDEQNFKDLDEILEENFIVGIDADPATNFEGFVSKWKTSDGNEVLVYSNYFPEDENFSYDYIPNQTWDDICENYLGELVETPEEHQSFFAYSGRTAEEVERLYKYGKKLDEIDTEIEIIQLLFDWQGYYGGVFELRKTADDLESVVFDIVY